MQLAPIILFTYNRPWHTKQVLDKLVLNKEAKDSILYVYCDGAKENAEQATIDKIEEVRLLAKNENRFKQVIIKEQVKNKGLANSIIDGVTEIVNKHGVAIVLEDDIVVSPYFLKYMNGTLINYQNVKEVACISGYVYPAKYKFPDTFFIKGSDCWGWATWKRAWDVFEKDGVKLAENLIKTNRVKEFDFGNTYPYYKMLQDQINGKNNSWAIRWYASCFLKNKLCLYPGKTHVVNIGFDGSGTHCGNTDGLDKTEIKFDVKDNTIYPQKMEEDSKCKKAFAEYFLEPYKTSFFSKIKNKIKKTLELFIQTKTTSA